MTIKQRQHLLAYLGYYVGLVDGDWGAGSRAACTAFQKDRNITPDGYGGPETDKQLRYAVANDLENPTVSKKETVDKESLTTGTFWDEIEFFTREEFRCHCGGKYCNGFPAEPKEQLVRIADQLRKNLGVPITVVSGLRCPEWNRIQKGVKTSQHQYGEAVDIYARGKTQAQVERELDRIGGVRYHYAIAGSQNVHFDIPMGAR